MNIINFINPITKATNYNFSNQNTSATKQEKISPTKYDSYIPAEKPSLLPDPYTLDNVKNSSLTGSSLTDKVCTDEIDIENLSQDEYNRYFAFRWSDSDPSNAEYLPIIHASKEVQIAWINSIKDLNPHDMLWAKTGVAMATGVFWGDEYKGDSFSLKDLTSALQNASTENMLIPSATPNDSRQEMSDYWLNVMQMIEKNYQAYMDKKKSENIEDIIKLDKI